jgi:hypothetical protein
MTGEHLNQLLKNADVRADSDDFQVAAEGRLLTLYVAQGGVNLTITRIEALKRSADLLTARTQKGEVYIVRLDDVFAGSIDGMSPPKRRPGFV